MTQPGEEVTIEHAIGMSGGSKQIRNDHPDVDRIYPLAEWIDATYRLGGKVYQRKIIVVEDWTEVPR